VVLTPAALAGWSAPQLIATARVDETVLPTGVVIQNDGEAAAALSRCVQTLYNCYEADIANGDASGSFTPATLLASGTEALAFAGDRTGDQVLATGGNGDQLTMYYKSATTGWDAGQTLPTSGLGDSLDIQVAIDALGDAVVVADADERGGGSMWASVHASGATSWTPLSYFSSVDQFGGHGSFAFDGQGNVYFSWIGTNPITVSRTGDVLLVTGSLLTGTFGTPVKAETGLPKGSLGPGLAASRTGALTLAWSAKSRIMVADSPGGNVFGTPVKLAKYASRVAIQGLAQDAAGDATVVWTGPQTLGSPLLSRYRLAGSTTWSAVQTLAQPVGSVVVSRSDADGGVAVAYGGYAVVKPSVAAPWSPPTQISSDGFVWGGIGQPFGGIDMNQSGQAIVELVTPPQAEISVSQYTP
jgi:hypothetical protein